MLNEARTIKVSNSSLILKNQSLVKLAQPLPQATVAGSVQSASVNQKLQSRPTTPSTTAAPTAFSALNAQISQMSLVKPTLQISSRGVPKDQLTLPISPWADVRDDVLFEDPKQAVQKYYLPRYRLLERNQQVQISLDTAPTGWKLTVQLEKYPAAKLGTQVRSATELAHTVSVLLQHRLTPGDANGGQKELVFEEMTPTSEGLTAVLLLNTATERDLLYQVLTNPDYGAKLMVRRLIKVAVPASGNDEKRYYASRTIQDKKQTHLPVDTIRGDSAHQFFTT
ncbi:MAG: hypothetical protein F6K42_22930, partial [Leptolyngbya sp. SIO1D8]|nr:hypothetical protein [Leptolyngbya sp. SIO1D8]